MAKTNPNARRIPSSSLIFNAAASRYIDPTSKKFLSGARVRAIIDQDIVSCGERMQQHGAKLKAQAQQFKAGAITQDAYNDAVRAFRDGVASQLKGLHLGNVAAGVGGFHAMGPKENGLAGGRIRGQLAYLNNFVIECAGNPDVVLNEAKGKRKFEDRLSSYAAAGRGTFEASDKQAHIAAGYLGIVNRLEANAHHCEGANSCPSMTALGTVPIDDPRFLLPGYRRCGNFCRCLVEYSMEMPAQ